MGRDQGQEIALTIPGDSRYLAMMRAVIAEAVAVTGFGDEIGGRIVLGVCEAASNIISHCYQNCCKPITIRCLMAPDRLEIRMRDYGRKPDPAKLKGRDPDDVRPGGLGIHIMRQTMDEVYYDLSLQVGTELKLVKYKPGHGPAGAG